MWYNWKCYINVHLFMYADTQFFLDPQKLVHVETKINDVTT